jgi:hypothetical protein
MSVGPQTGRIYIDDPIISHRGRWWAHMFSTNLYGLHAMARELGVRPWFQDPATMPVRWPHYDITANTRERALELGAIALDRYQTLVMANHIMGWPQQQSGYRPIALALIWLEREIEVIGMAHMWPPRGDEWRG